MKRILFFSRGLGHGHAIPDISIAKAMEAAEDIEINFASYATGAKTFKTAGRAVYDLGLPEQNAYLPTLFKACELLQRVQPDVVISHEEFPALPAAHLFGIPSIFVSAWLPLGGKISAESLIYASSIVVLDEPGIFPLPPGVQAKPIYVGPILRKMAYTVADRARVRRELNIQSEAPVVVVVPGGGTSEEFCPILDVVLSAFLRLPSMDRRLFWLSAKDHAALATRTAGIKGVTILDFVDPVERILAAADVIITKGTRGITLDAASLGVPSISLSAGTNPIDDLLVPRISNNIALNARAVDGDVLHFHLTNVLRARPVPAHPPPEGSGARPAAEALLAEIRRVSSLAKRATSATSATVNGTNGRQPVPTPAVT